MTIQQTRCSVFIVLVSMLGNGCGPPSTEDKVKAIGGALPRHHMSFGPTAPVSASFYGPTITDEKLAGIDLESLPTVINVTINGTALTSDGLATVGRWTQVKQLSLDDNPGIDDRGLPFILPLKSLSFLSLNKTSVGNEGLRHLRDLTSLTSLSLVGTRVGDEGVKHLTGLRNLSHLILSGTQITDQALEHLADMPELQRLDLFDTSVTDAGMPVLVKLPKLYALHLRGTQVTDEAANELKRLRELKQRPRLTISGLSED